MRSSLLMMIGCCLLLAWAVPSLSDRLAMLGRAEPIGEARPEPAWAAAQTGYQRLVVGVSQGHFMLDAMVNGEPVRFLVDSGASTIVLRPDDARRAGISAGQLRYQQRLATANGVIQAASVTLRDLSVGQLRLRDVQAVVPEVDPGISLLGMTFLSRLRAWEANADRLVLSW